MRQLELSAKTQGVLLALTLPTLLATLLSLGLEASGLCSSHRLQSVAMGQVVRPLALQTSWKALGAPRQRYFDLCLDRAMVGSMEWRSKFKALKFGSPP